MRPPGVCCPGSNANPTGSVHGPVMVSSAKPAGNTEPWELSKSQITNPHAIIAISREKNFRIRAGFWRTGPSPFGAGDMPKAKLYLLELRGVFTHLLGLSVHGRDGYQSTTDP